MARKAVYATDTILLGLHGEIKRGQEVPETYTNSVGGEDDTDFDRLEELGLISTDKPEDAPEPDADEEVHVESNSDDTDPEDAPEPVNYSKLNHDQLEAEAKQRGLDVQRTDGSDGAIRNADYVAALEKDDAASND